MTLTRRIFCALLMIGAFEAARADDEIHLAKGDKFPAYALGAISKAKLDKKDLGGKVVVYDVGASWAHGAAEALPYYITLLNKYKKRGLRVVAINIDNEKETALKHIKGVTTEFPVLYDEDKKFVKKINPEGFPMVYVVDRKGIVQDVIRDYCEQEFDLLEKRITSVIDRKN